MSAIDQMPRADDHLLAVNDGPVFTHRTDCPATRVERYDAVRPGKPSQGVPPRDLRVTRCIDCGNHDVQEA